MTPRQEGDTEDVLFLEYVRVLLTAPDKEKPPWYVPLGIRARILH